MSPVRANMYGALAILLWSSTPLIFIYCSTIPPFMLAGLTSLVGFSVFLVKWFVKQEDIKGHFSIPWLVIVFCVFGIGGYRALYLFSLGIVPVVEASLINYLWPVLIVLFSSFLKENTFKMRHIIGVVAGFCGVVVLLSRPEALFSDLSSGHILAFIAAVMWAGYSVLTRLIPSYTGNAVPVSFLFSGILLLVTSVFTESFAAADWSQTPFVILMGLAASLGYFLWDAAMKHGHIQILGVSSYMTPLLATLLLILFAKAVATPSLVLATFLIVLGPMIASWDKVMAAHREYKRVRAEI